MTTRSMTGTTLALCALALAATPLFAQAPPPTPPPPAPGTVPAAAPAPPPAWKDNVYFGGGVGLAFGDIDYVEIAPLVGYKIHPRVSTGLGVFYRWRNDDRYEPSLETSDYGGNVFARFAVTKPLFAHVEWEYLDYEYLASTGATFRDSESNVLVGAGFVQPMGGSGAVSAAVLYNLSYDDNDPYRAYDSPWVYRIGFTFGF